MKKTTSFHLEEDIIAEIEAYKEKHNLSSRNAALERMLLERRNILSFQEKEPIDHIITKKDAPVVKEDKLIKSIEDSFKDMPE